MNREPSSELVSAVTPVKTEKESSAATPATPNAAMPGAAPHSLALALSLEYEYPRKKKVKWGGGEKITKSYLPLFHFPFSPFPCLFVSVTE